MQRVESKLLLGDAIDNVLRSATAPLTSQDILVTLAGMGDKLARGVPNYNTLRSHLSAHRAERGWVLEGRGRSARWRKGEPYPKSVDPQEVAA